MLRGELFHCETLNGSSEACYHFKANRIYGPSFLPVLPIFGGPSSHCCKLLATSSWTIWDLAERGAHHFVHSQTNQDRQNTGKNMQEQFMCTLKLNACPKLHTFLRNTNSIMALLLLPRPHLGRRAAADWTSGTGIPCGVVCSYRQPLNLLD